jgi:hypothetical protein
MKMRKKYPVSLVLTEVYSKNHPLKNVFSPKFYNLSKVPISTSNSLIMQKSFEIQIMHIISNWVLMYLL